MGDRPVITLQLTEEQRAAIKRLTGKDAIALELSAEELERKLTHVQTLAPNRRAAAD
ncbi:MAG: hypothetical protein OER90_19445 [Gemmatimonadota bacterium]|nr:hypothetical protein [Gemmatimonadota bacterium]